MTQEERIVELETRLAKLESYVSDLFAASCGETQDRLRQKIAQESGK